jgi:hypothetical protein
LYQVAHAIKARAARQTQKNAHFPRPEPIQQDIVLKADLPGQRNAIVV